MLQRTHYYRTPRPHPNPNYWPYEPYEYYNQAFYPDVPVQEFPSQPHNNPTQTPYEYFQKPEQPMNWPNNNPPNDETMNQQMNQQLEQQQLNQQMNEPMNMQQQQQPNLPSQFQKDGGQIDFDKMLSTVGQLASTYHQVAPIVQQFSGFLKNFRA